MQVRVLCFGVLKDWLGAPEAQVSLPEGATVAALLKELNSGSVGMGMQPDWQKGIAVSVNAEYAQASQTLLDGDEVGLLPPVSGGSAAPSVASATEQPFVVALTRDAIESDKLAAAVKRGDDGAVVIFDGIVRNNTRGRQTLYLDYEAYEEMAAKQMEQLAAEARSRFGVRQVTMIHRLGRLGVGETSVFIVVASAHRAAAYEASRWLIDTLKQTVPIWKKETFVDGAVWAAGEPFPDELALRKEASDEA
jgi:molybdopterin synthase catalytic subunit